MGLRRYGWLVVALLLAPGTTPPSAAGTSAGPSPLHVTGNRLVDATGRTVQLRGVNRNSPEVRCMATGQASYFDGPTDAASVAAMRAWHVNTVRVPVNEDCWLGRNGLPASGTAEQYRAELVAYARLLTANGLYVVVDLHFAETSVLGVALPSTGEAPMADRAYGLALWQSVVAALRDDPGVLYDLYNEPHDVTWACWRDGCGDYAGMRDLVDAVRAAGAVTPLVLTGPSWGNEISKWLEYAPRDPLGALVAGVHMYAGAGCSDLACRQERIQPVAAAVPVVVGELGDTACGSTFLDTLAAWADSYGIGYLAFTWNTPPRTPCPGYHLIQSFDGQPTATGARFRTHLALRDCLATARTRAGLTRLARCARVRS